MGITNAFNKRWAARKDPVALTKIQTNVVGGVLLALVLGAGTQGFMLYSQSLIVTERLSTMGSSLKELETEVVKIREASVDRWSRTEHERFAAGLQSAMTNLHGSTTTNAAEIKALLRTVEDLRKDRK